MEMLIKNNKHNNGKFDDARTMSRLCEMRILPDHVRKRFRAGTRTRENRMPGHST